MALPRSVLLAAVTLAGLSAQPNAEAPLIRHTFDSSQEGWIAFGQNATIRLTRDPAHVKSGHSALALDYKMEPKQIGVAILPIPDGSLREMKRLRFWLKSDSTTSVGVWLSEKKPGGGDYSAIVWSPKDKWQQIDLIPADFSPNSGPKDPVDADGRLDMDQVQNIGIADLAQIFGAAPENPNFQLAIDRPSGARSLSVDDFEVLASGPAAQNAIDDFHRSFLSWFTLGGAELSVAAPGNPLGTSALEAKYEQTPERYVLIGRGLPPGVLNGATGLSFDLASEKDAQIVLALEQRGGVRYNATVDTSGGRSPVHKTVAFSEFNLDRNGPPDPGGRIDPQKVKSVFLLDISGAFTNQSHMNTLWFGDLKAVR